MTDARVPDSAGLARQNRAVSSQFTAAVAIPLSFRAASLLLLATGAAFATPSYAQSTAYLSEAVTPSIFDGDLRDLPKIRPWPSAEPLSEAPPRRHIHVPQPSPIPGLGKLDPLLSIQEQASINRSVARAFTTLDLNFDGLGNSGVVPPDTVGEVGVDYYIQITNGNTGSPFAIHSKATGALVAGPSDLSSLWTSGGACSVGKGYPIVLYDQLAGRWLLSEFADSGSHLCVYVSQTSDPISGGWYNYDFSVPEFPDYPKYAVWPDAYYVSSNESSPTGYALDRTQMLAV